VARRPGLISVSRADPLASQACGSISLIGLCRPPMRHAIEKPTASLARQPRRVMFHPLGPNADAWGHPGGIRVKTTQVLQMIQLPEGTTS